MHFVYMERERLREQLAQARALLFPGEEDLGIVPVEAQSFGQPVIAFGSGGALETVRGNIPGHPLVVNPTGGFFCRQTVEGIRGAILEFEAAESAFSAGRTREHALQFDREILKRKMALFVSSALENREARNLMKIEK
jgi:glycosyltransferase involved in cell wall biosynthesis